MAPTHTTIDYVVAWATLGTAVGTTGLAAVTYFLARRTKQLAKSGDQTAEAAEKTARAAEASLSVATRPVLLPTAGWVDELGAWHQTAVEHMDADVYITVRNVGVGPALNATAELRFDSTPDWQRAIGPPVVVALHERARLRFTDRRSAIERGMPGRFRIRIRCEDVFRSTFEMECDYHTSTQEYRVLSASSRMGTSLNPDPDAS